MSQDTEKGYKSQDTKENDNVLLFDYFKELSAAFKRDCEDLLSGFEHLNSLNYNDFASVWVEKGFTNIFAGFQYGVLIKYFCENCFYTIKKYIMFPKNQYTQLGAFYLLYGLYYKQPLKDYVKIRVTLEEFEQLVQMIERLRTNNQLDAVYIFNKMKMESVFVYVAFRKPLGPELKFIRDQEAYFDDTFISRICDTTINKIGELLSSPLINELEKVNEEYKDFLKQSSEQYPSGMFESTLNEDLQQCWSYLKTGFVDSSEAKTGTTHKLSRIQKIRNKAMMTKNAVYRGERSVVTAADNLKLPDDSISND